MKHLKTEKRSLTNDLKDYVTECDSEDAQFQF